MICWCGVGESALVAANPAASADAKQILFARAKNGHHQPICSVQKKKSSSFDVAHIFLASKFRTIFAVSKSVNDESNVPTRTRNFRERCFCTVMYRIASFLVFIRGPSAQILQILLRVCCSRLPMLLLRAAEQPCASECEAMTSHLSEPLAPG